MNRRKEKKKLTEFFRTPLFGKSRSFSNIATSRKFKLNKQKFEVNGISLRMSVKEIKTINRWKVKKNS